MTTLGDPPAAGDVPGLAGSFSEETRRWYATWAGSPQASMFTGTDWQRLAMLAPLVDAYFAEPTKELLGEIRLNEALLGATPVDRLRLRWKLPDAGDGSAVATPPRPARRTADPRLRAVG
jgi:hypothetical protein